MAKTRVGGGGLGVLRLVLVTTSVWGADDPARIASALERHDRAAHVLDDWMRDPYVVLGPDDWFYLTCTRLSQIEGGKEGIQLWRSRDLAEWENLGPIWTVEDSKWMGPLVPAAREAGKVFHVWAPEVHFLDGRWIAVHTTSVRRANLLVAGSAELKGPFAEPVGTSFGHRHDPSIFTDDDGTHWLVWACARVAPLKADMSGFAGPETRIEPSNRKMGHEGCLIRKVGGKYVLFGTAWSTDQMRHGTYNLYYCTAEKVTGPYGRRRFAGRFCGHGTLFQDRRGRWWTAAFLNGSYVSPEHVREHGIDASPAETINKQGLTLVPLEVTVEAGDVRVGAEDPDYARPGPEEVQKF